MEWLKEYIVGAGFLPWQYRKQRKQCRLHKETAYVAVILFCFWAFGIGSTYGFSIFPDEFAYWSYAAGFAGYDWSHITSLGPYYSYGYSLILTVLFVLCKDAIAAYRIAVSLNFVFLFLTFFILTGTMKKIVPEGKFPVEMFSALAVLTPWNLFYTQTTLTETLLLCLYVAVGGLLFLYLENDRLPTLILLMLVLMYLYIVHMRTVGILLSGVLVLGIHIWRQKEKRNHIWVVLGMMLALLFMADVVKENVLACIYGNTKGELALGNDYGGQIEKIRYILTREGFYDLVISIWGKILYLGLASYGLFYWGIYGLIKELRRKEQRKKEFALFLLLGIATQIMVSTIYLLTLGEISDYTYGRYNEMILPFVTVAGFAELWKERAWKVWAASGILALMQAGTAFLVVCQIIHTGVESFHGYFMVGISYLYNESNFSAGGFYLGAFLFCEFLTMLVTAAILFCRGNHKRRYMMAGLVVMELVLAMHSEKIYLEPFKRAAFRDSRMAEKISLLQEPNQKIIYVNHNPPAYIGILQFMARDAEIHIVERKEEVSEADLVIFAFDDLWIEDLKDRFTYEDTYGHFTLLYNKER